MQLIGYHHQVRDSVGGQPVMITYCTVCRTGRAFSPIVNGNAENFRLVGMDHFNAMFEDATTKSWWQQANGAAIAGPLKGTVLQEIPSRQATLAAWLQAYPHSLVMQPDNAFAKQYEQMAKYDRGNGNSALTKRDAASWQPKSWVVGIQLGAASKAYDWNELASKKMLQDSLAEVALLVTLESDTATFHVFDRSVNGRTLTFMRSGDRLTDNNMSSWTFSGLCTDGVTKGQKLKELQAYQEFWHSWRTFHPGTLR
jgi:uncharacterized protein DUF3179